IEVDWCIKSVEGSHFSYGRPEDGNLWLHLFEPLPFPGNRRCLSRRINWYVDNSITWKHAYHLYHGDPSWLVRYNRAFSEYIRLRSHISRRVKAFYDEQMAGRHCIGFHIRNALHRSEMPGNVMPGIEDFVDKANAIIHAGNSKPVVFLATDVVEAVEIFSSRVQAEVIVQPGVERESRASGRQLHHSHSRPSTKLAEDVLIDCLLLAKCDVFVHITSNLATAVGYMNPNLSMIYLE
ncbi:MAG: hypothetical protein JRK53_21190, partial [Deltaproteobacteria bacterium]|nr:hypothetical protein [Deltaproteobacteria bacterium]